MYSLPEVVFLNTVCFLSNLFQGTVSASEYRIVGLLCRCIRAIVSTSKVSGMARRISFCILEKYSSINSTVCRFGDRSASMILNS